MVIKKEPSHNGRDTLKKLRNKNKNYRLKEVIKNTEKGSFKSNGCSQESGSVRSQFGMLEVLPNFHLRLQCYFVTLSHTIWTTPFRGIWKLFQIICNFSFVRF